MLSLFYLLGIGFLVLSGFSGWDIGNLCDGGFQISSVEFFDSVWNVVWEKKCY